MQLSRDFWEMQQISHSNRTEIAATLHLRVSEETVVMRRRGQYIVNHKKFELINKVDNPNWSP